MKQGHIKLLKKRRLLIIFCIIIAFLFCATILTTSMIDMFARYESKLDSAVHAINRQYSNTESMDALYQESMKDCSEAFVGYCAYYFYKHGYTEETTAALSDQISKYFLTLKFDGTLDSETKTANGTLYSGYEYKAEMIDNSLTPENLYKLLTEGYFSTPDANYNSAKINAKSYAIIVWNSSDFMIRQSILSTFPSNLDETLCRINADTKIIEDSNHAEIVGLSIDDVISNNYSINNVLSDKLVNIKLKDNTAVLMYTCKEINGMYLVAYIPVKALTILFLRNCSIPIILTITFMFLILIYMLRFMKPNSEEEKNTIEYFHFFKNIYSDLSLVSHNLALGIISMLIVILSTLYVETLINYCNQNISAEYNLSSLDCFISDAEQNEELMKSDFDMTYSAISDTLADYYLKYPNEVNDKDLGAMLKHLPNISSLTIFDKTATIVSDTNTRNGYTITNDIASPEYIVRDVIYGNTDIGSYSQDDKYYVMSRRQDDVGVVRICVDNYYLEEFCELCKPDKQLEAADFQLSIKGYIPKSEPDTIYLMYYGSNKLDNITAPYVKDTLNHDGYTGMQKIDGRHYLLNIKESNNYYLVSAYRTSSLQGGFGLFNSMAIFLAFFLQQLMIFIVSLRTKEESPNISVDFMDTSSFNQSLDAKMMDANFRKLFKQIILITALSVIVLFVTDSSLENTSIMSYLLDSSWPKGFNMFSLTMILLTIFGAILASKAFELLMVFFTRNMGPRGLTIGRMLCSFSKFLALILVFFLILIDLGVDYKTLLAGAGIAGVAVTVCAQSSISDMLSGFLIVFENLFNIGDWITVDDFRGQVTEIGVRTTKLQISNTVKILNNSQLKNVTVMERNGQGCIVLIDIAYKEDANEVINLLKNSTERFKHDIPAIKEGPFIDGIVDLNSSGVTLYMWAITDLEVVRATERELRRVTKNIFDENNIEIPFTQVTLHQAND